MFQLYSNGLLCLLVQTGISLHRPKWRSSTILVHLERHWLYQILTTCIQKFSGCLNFAYTLYIGTSTSMCCWCYIVQDCAEHAYPRKINKFEYSVILSMMCAEIPVDSISFLGIFVFHVKHYAVCFCRKNTQRNPRCTKVLANASRGEAVKQILE